jgi:aryl-alcohol dehydrogenase-like predicted oxidoreductase
MDGGVNKMEYRVLGKTGVHVSTYALGTMMFGENGNRDEQECIKIIHAALDAGINLIDTADTYADGQAEDIVGKALQGRRDQVVLATKFRLQFGHNINQQGASRLWIMREVEASLRRLRTDHIDFYQIHRPDLDTDLEETIGALTDLVRQGKIRYFGSSAFPGWYMSEAHALSRLRGLGKLSSETSSYSIFVRGVELELLPAVQHYGMGFMAWSPLNGGWLTGKYRRGTGTPEDSRANLVQGHWGEHYPVLRTRFDMERPGNLRKLEMIDSLLDIAAQAGISLTHMALAFPLVHPAVTAVNIGVRNFKQFEDLRAGFNVKLDDSILDAIDQVNPPGENVEIADRGWTPSWMAKHARRRQENQS